MHPAAVVDRLEVLRHQALEERRRVGAAHDHEPARNRAVTVPAL